MAALPIPDPIPELQLCRPAKRHRPEYFPCLHLVCVPTVLPGGPEVTTLAELLWTALSKRHTLIAFVLLFACPLFGKRKDDLVIMTNGDKFTGEIKSLQYGELIFKSDYMKDSVYLDWKRVKSLESQDTFIVSLTNGKRLTGLIGKDRTPTEDSKDFKIVADGSAVEVTTAEVIAIGQREASFWNQLTGSIDYGFGFASGNKQTNSSLGAGVAFRTTKNSVQLATTSQFGSQTNAKNTNRFTFDSQYARLLTQKWLAAGLFSLLRSNQQDLTLRSTYGGGFGRKLVQTDRTSLTVLGGAAFSHESYIPQPGTEPIHNNAESLLGVTFSTFRFKTLNLRSRTLLFPSLSDPGRLRVSSQSGLRIELIRNFNWNFDLYENYDSRPPTSAPKNDLGITTSVGWTF
jgi:putative salt-induced outer membrane protein YdiY